MKIRVPGEGRQRTRLCGQALRQLTDIDQRLDACLLTFQAGAPELAALLIEVESVQLPIETVNSSCAFRSVSMLSMGCASFG